MEKQLNLFGIKTTIESDDSQFLHVAEESLSFFKKISVKNEEIFKDTALEVTFLTSKKVSPSSVVSGFSKIGNNAFVKENEYVYFYGPFVVKMARKGKKIEILAQYRRGMSLRKSTEDLIKNLTKRHSDYFLLIRMLILFPLFTLLEREKGIFLMHGSAVKFQGEGIIFAGLASVGKSIAALSLTLDKNARFLTDNFLLFNEDYIFPFPEYVRVSHDAQSLIAGVSQLGKSVLRRFKRNYYVLNDDFISSKIQPKVLFIPRLVEKADYIRKIFLETALDSLLLANDHVKEFHNYHFCGLLNYGYDSSESIYKRKIRTLECLLSKVDIYEIGIPKSLKPSDYLEGVIKNAL
ncbi:MAG: hypothetical protein ABIH85_08835 [Candidatus Omnitrophota bacterium]